MALHFVKTAVLTSADGIDFGTEVAVESDETRQAKLDAEAATRKPLFQQLADLRDKKQDEFDENRKKIFGTLHRSSLTYPLVFFWSYDLSVAIVFSFF
jgi:FAM192A/Fyv6, N-terminal domain